MSLGRAVLAAAIIAVPTPAPRVVTRAEFIAERLAHDPVFVSDAVPREVSPADTAKIRAAIRRMPAPTYIAVVPDIDVAEDPDGAPERLIALLHDRLDRDGVYIVIPSSGIGLTASQFGESLPIHPASSEVVYSQPYDAGPVRVVARFVDDIRSGHAQQRYDEVYARSKTGWEAKPYGDAADLGDTFDEAGALSGLGAAVLLGAVFLVRRRRRGRAR